MLQEERYNLDEAQATLLRDETKFLCRMRARNCGTSLCLCKVGKPLSRAERVR